MTFIFYMQDKAYFLKIYFLLFLKYVVCIHEFRGQRRGPPWSWSYRWLWATWHECWELNSGLLEEQCVLLTAEPSLEFPTPPPDRAFLCSPGLLLVSTCYEPHPWLKFETLLSQLSRCWDYRCGLRYPVFIFKRLLYICNPTKLLIVTRVEVELSMRIAHSV